MNVTPGADLRHVDAWLFDLDDTLYRPQSAVMDLIRARITGLVMRVTGLGEPEARALQRGWYLEHGAALPGLLAAYDIAPAAFLDEVHDVSLEALDPDPALDRALARLPGRRLVFTNGSAGHAARVLDKLAIADRFEAVFHIESADLRPKPAPATFDRMIAAFGLDPQRTAFFEDSPRNLAPAAALGMTTVLVGPDAPSDALASGAPVVHHRTADLAAFLDAAQVAGEAGP